MQKLKMEKMRQGIEVVNFGGGGTKGHVFSGVREGGEELLRGEGQNDNSEKRSQVDLSGSARRKPNSNTKREKEEGAQSFKKKAEKKKKKEEKSSFGSIRGGNGFVVWKRLVGAGIRILYVQ